jgi:hypothetical protein
MEGTTRNIAANLGRGLVVETPRRRLNSLRKKEIPVVIPSAARNLSALNAKKKRDS